MRHKKVLVIGMGRFGSALTEELLDTHCELVVVDKRPEAVDAHKARISAAFVADASDPGVLEHIGARDMDVAVVTPGEEFETTVLCVSQLAQMGVKTIFARAANDRQAHVLRAVGATRAVQVENEMGRRLAVQVLNPVAAHLSDFAMHFRVVPWSPKPPYVGMSLASAQLRRFDLNVLGYLRNDPAQSGGKPRMQLPGADYVINENDTLLLVSEDEALERFFASLE
ncbi:MAG TPA: TrkA family potassium uptake protein [Polyangiaceae bacterium]|nr:TrkA family potassium uptake protein [Polyangiaceae bacterium]